MAQLVAGIEKLTADLGHRAVTVESVLFDKITICGCLLNYQTMKGTIVQLKMDFTTQTSSFLSANTDLSLQDCLSRLHAHLNRLKC